MQAKVVKANVLFNRLLKLTLGKYLIRKFRVECSQEKIRNLKPPYLILANHVTNWDPFLLSNYVDSPVHFVISDEQYRYPVRRFFLKYFVGGIPKTKFVSDLVTVKNILKLVKKNCVVGIFPEGGRNWDGVTEKILPSTAKLVKSLKIPVVICILEGAYLSHPRWALHNRAGKIHIHFKHVLTADQIQAMSTAQIEDALNELLAYNEYARQAKKQIPYRGIKIAEKLERFLFTCPQCHAIGTMLSQEDRFCCGACGYGVIYTETGYFQPTSQSAKDKLFFSEPYSWNQWQLQYLAGLMAGAASGQEDSLILKDENVSLFSADKFTALNKISEGTLRLDHESFSFICQERPTVFQLRLMKGLNIQYSNELEFYYENRLYRFRFAHNGVSAYKWLCALSLAESSLLPHLGGRNPQQD